MAEPFVQQIDDVYDQKGNVYDSLFGQYEHVVMHSLITSFGLDFLVRDQHGGDVDTIHNVGMIDKDPLMKYKNSSNEAAYNSLEDYDAQEYHTNKFFIAAKNKFKDLYQQGQKVRDAYTGEELGFASGGATLTPKQKAELDHIIPTSEIHYDRRRVLANVNGVEIANREDNFAWTNKSLNASKKNMSNSEYVQAHPELDKKTKRRMLETEKKANESYEAVLNRSYYTSPAFFRDSALAAGQVGFKMGLRQVLGLVFSEIWFAVKSKLKSTKNTYSSLFENIANGVKEGLQNAKQRYKQLWDEFVKGAIAGTLSSLTTTICNMFFTTAKNIVRLLRQAWVSLVEACKILFFNPQRLPLGERLRAAAKVLATGASVLVGVTVSELVAKTGLGTIPVVGDIVQTFCGTLVSGIMSCSLLYILDRNAAISMVVNFLNSLSDTSNEEFYKQQVQLLEEYGAKIMRLDLDKFRAETALYQNAANRLLNTNNQNDLYYALQDVRKQLGLSSPCGDMSFDEFMRDPNSRLVFK